VAIFEHENEVYVLPKPFQQAQRVGTACALIDVVCGCSPVDKNFEISGEDSETRPGCLFWGDSRYFDVSAKKRSEFHAKHATLTTKSQSTLNF
jgi:hypothetical protein